MGVCVMCSERLCDIFTSCVSGAAEDFFAMRNQKHAVLARMVFCIVALVHGCTSCACISLFCKTRPSRDGLPMRIVCTMLDVLYVYIFATPARARPGREGARNVKYPV